MKRIMIAACAVTAVAALAGCGGSASGSSSSGSSNASKMQSITVSFELNDSNRKSSCSSGGGGGFTDISSGSPVVVRDGKQNVITTVPLGSDCKMLDPNDFRTNNMGGVWTTHVSVPTGKGPYSFEVSHRGALTFTEAQLKQNGWVAKLHLGD